MKHFRRIAGIMLFLSLSFSFLHAQDLGDLTKARMDFIFEHLDKDKVETGLLSDYGCLWTEPYAYNGVLADTNYVCMETWKSLYLSMYTTRINNKVTLKEPQLVFNSLRDDAPALLCLQYNRLDENAVNNGLLKFENEQLWETGRAGSPYLKKDLFAVALPDAEYYSQVSFTFHQENYISNSRGTPFQLAIRFAPGSAYQPVTWGQPVSHTFTSLGEKEISVRVSFNNGKTLESHARIRIILQPIRYAGEKNDTTITVAQTNKHSGGKIQIKYATFNTEKKQLIRPLIIADESDIYKFLKNENINLEYLLAEKNTAKMLETINKVYDIVYVDNNKGFDDIFRNAQLFEDAMERINNMRGSVHDQSYVIGLGMGGLVASYALRDMENQGKKHDVCKLITINTPHKGFNMPIGLQALIRHLHRIILAKLFLKDISNEAKKLCDLLDQKAMKQMLIYSIDKTFSYQNDHNEFMQKYEEMGMPAKCRNVAISNGSYLGNNLFQPGGRLFEFYFKKGTKKFIWKLLLLGNTEIRFDCTVNALKSRQATQLYYGNLYLHKKILFKYVDINYNTRTLNSTSDMVALDGAPGSKIPVKQFFSGDDDILNAFKRNDFCFVPTASAFGMDDWQNKLLSRIDLTAESSGFDKLYSTEGNNDYAELAACKDFLLQELAPQIIGNNRGIVSNTEFELTNLPSMITESPLIAAVAIKWQLSNDKFKIVSRNGSKVVIAPLQAGAACDLKALVTLNNTTEEIASIPLFSGQLEIIPDNEYKYVSGSGTRFHVNIFSPASTLLWSYANGIRVQEQKDDYIVISGCDISFPWLQANVTTNGTTMVKRIELKNEPLPNSMEIKVDKDVWYKENGEIWFLLRAVHEPRVGGESFEWKVESMLEGEQCAKFYERPVVSFDTIPIRRNSYGMNDGIFRPVFPDGTPWYERSDLYGLRGDYKILIFKGTASYTKITCILNSVCKSLTDDIIMSSSGEIASEMFPNIKLKLGSSFTPNPSNMRTWQSIILDHSPCQKDESIRWEVEASAMGALVTLTDERPCTPGSIVGGDPPILITDKEKAKHNEIFALYNNNINVRVKIKCYLTVPCGTFMSEIQFAPKLGTMYPVQPNPADGWFWIQKKEPVGGTIMPFSCMSAPDIISVKLYNNFGLVRSLDNMSIDSGIQVNVADLPNGTYYLNILKNGEVIDRQVVMIEH